MDVLHPRCGGLDVHRSSISACILLREAGRVQKHQRRFGAMTQDLHELAEWLRQFGVTHMARESSGVYWKPVWNILDREFAIVLANAQHIKNVPGSHWEVAFGNNHQNRNKHLELVVLQCGGGRGRDRSS